MFNLIRRISGSIHPRSDRPWNDDATSNAPTVRKRRRSSSASESEDVKEERARVKKLRSSQTEEQPALTPDATVTEEALTPIPEAKEKEALEVKEVTQGVKEVELEEKPEPAPENVRLPSEEAGELDDPATSPPPSEKGDLPPAPETEQVGDVADAIPIAKTNDQGDAITQETISTTTNDIDSTEHAPVDVPVPEETAATESKPQLDQLHGQGVSS